MSYFVSMEFLLECLGTTEDELEILEDKLEIQSQRQLLNMLARKKANSRLIRMAAVKDVNEIEWITAKQLLEEEQLDIKYRVNGF